MGGESGFKALTWPKAVVRLHLFLPGISTNFGLREKLEEERKKEEQKSDTLNTVYELSYRYVIASLHIVVFLVMYRMSLKGIVSRTSYASLTGDFYAETIPLLQFPE